MLAESTDSPAATTTSSPLARWNIAPTDFGIFLAFFFACMVVVSSIAGKITGKLIDWDTATEKPLLVYLSENLGMQLGMLLAFLGFALATRSVDSDTKPNPAARSILIGLKWLAIAYPIMIAANLAWRTILTALGFERVIQDPVKLVLDGGTPLEQSLIYGMIVLVAPVCEELVFRGVIFRYFHQRLSLALALLLSAAFFAAVHFNLYTFVPLLVIGITLALAYRESGNILSSIAFHAAFNSINLLLILFFPELS